MNDSNEPFGPKDSGDGPGLMTLDRPRSAPPEPPREPEVIEDAGSQALSEALRSSFVIVKVLMVGLVILFICSGVFTVPSQKRAILLRFGKPVTTGEKVLLEPGLHWSWPYPIDEKIFIPLGQQTLRSTVGWYATGPDGSALNEGLSLNPAAEGYTITADANIIHVRTTLNYRIIDPLKYALNFVNATNALQNALDSAIVYVSSRTTVDDALRFNRGRFQERILDRVRELILQQDLGIALDPSPVEVVPPVGLKAKFEGVNAADAQRGEIVQKAAGQASRIVATARSDATNLVNLARADARRAVEGARADAQYFLNQLQYYTNNPALFTARLRTEALRQVMTNVQDKFFWGHETPLRLLLNRDPQKPPPPNPQP